MTPLTRLWILYLANSSWWVTMLPVVLLVDIDADGSELQIVLAIAAVCIVGTLVAVLVPWVSERARLRVGSAQELIASYMTRTIMRVGFVDLPIVLGVASWAITGSVAPYLISIPFAGLAASRAAPTRTRLEVDQQELNALGSTLRLREALATPSFGQ